MDANELVRRGFDLLGRGQIEEAARVSDEAAALAPWAVPVRMLACEIAVARQNYTEALVQIDAAIAAEPASVAYRFRKAEIRIMMRQGQEAQKIAADTAAQFPDEMAAQGAAATVFASTDNHEGAEPYIRRAAELGAKDALFLLAQTQNHFFLGRLNEAEASADALLAQAPSFGQGQLLRSRVRTQTPERNHVAELEALRKQELRPVDGVQVRYALSKELEDLGRFSEAFAALKEGANMRRRTLNYDSAAELKNIGDLIETFTPSAFASISPGAASDAPIFILGLPRTGTTLVERMVGAHASVRNAGEINDFPRAMAETINSHIAANPGAGLSPLKAALRADYRAMGERYLRYVEGMIGPSQRFIDKTPFNSVYAGLIHKALPKAAIIHLVRDPMDTCFSIYKNFFNQAYAYSYDLNELGDYYIAHRRLMAHWSQLAPNAILNVSYERLVADPEAESRRIMEFCRLPWSPDVVKVETRRSSSSTASAAQIRQPVYGSSVGAWRHYERELAPLHEKLSRAGVL